MDRQIDGWMDEWMDGWMNGWMTYDGQIYECMDETIHTCIANGFHFVHIKRVQNIIKN